MSHIWMSHSHVTYMNESCCPCEWVICDMTERVMSHIWMRHVVCVNKYGHRYEWAVSSAWTSHVTHTDECMVFFSISFLASYSKKAFSAHRSYSFQDAYSTPNVSGLLFCIASLLFEEDLLSLNIQGFFSRYKGDLGLFPECVKYFPDLTRLIRILLLGSCSKETFRVFT